MSRAERALSLLLRVEAAVVFCSLPAIVLPTAWMAHVHAWLDLGDLPRGPIVEYMARTLSMLYLGWAPLLWVMAGDVRRYLPLLWVFGAMSLAASFTFLALDLLIPMPLWWTVTEFGMVFAFAAGGLLLTWRVQREPPPA